MTTMTGKRDYYEILGVQKNASDKEIAGAYRQLAIKFHPDSNPGDADATERFKEAAEAYERAADLVKNAAQARFLEERRAAASGAG